LPKTKNKIYEINIIQSKSKITELINYLRKLQQIFIDNEIYKNESFVLTQLFILLNIDAIEIDDYAFNDGIQHQFIIFNPKSLIVIDKIKNIFKRNQPIFQYL
jgi:hypothetical protein